MTPTPPERTPRVLIADDQTLIRTGFRLILTSRGIDVVGEAADGAEAVAAARRLRPDVVLMDIRMPNMDGLEATRLILDHSPDCRVLILTTFDLDRYVYRALALGASGFLLKDVTPQHLAAAIRLVDTGDALLAPSITRRLVERFAGGHHAEDAAGTHGWNAGDEHRHDASRPAHTPTQHARLTALTPREREVLSLLGRGLSNAELAAELTLSEATVKSHVARIFAKLTLRDRAQAVVLAYETGLVRPGDVPPPSTTAARLGPDA
jgi:DNA-binding NarL/FixJ family response regulator